MKAVRLVRPGEPLQEAEVPVPEIGATEVLVQVAACGTCHSDAHYRAGVSQFDHLPVTLGHEVAGRVAAVGKGVEHVSEGDRVYVHYLVTCGLCNFCRRSQEQFCRSVRMIGKHRDGGYAEFIKVPARNVFLLPDDVSFEAGAIMMCSSATALHALRKARLQPGESLAIFGFGGLGFSALQLARALGAAEVYVVEINLSRLPAIAALGGIPVQPANLDPVQQIRAATGGSGVDVSIDLVGSARTMQQAVQCLRVLGRAAMVALSSEALSVFPYPELIDKEAEIIGVSDHLADELAMLMDFARSGQLTFPTGTLRTVDLDAAQINAALDAVTNSTGHIRSVIVPGG